MSVTGFFFLIFLLVVLSRLSYVMVHVNTAQGATALQMGRSLLRLVFVVVIFAAAVALVVYLGNNLLILIEAWYTGSATSDIGPLMGAILLFVSGYLLAIWGMIFTAEYLPYWVVPRYVTCPDCETVNRSHNRHCLHCGYTFATGTRSPTSTQTIRQQRERRRTVGGVLLLTAVFLPGMCFAIFLFPAPDAPSMPGPNGTAVPILPTATPIHTVNMVIAVQEIPYGTTIPANAVAIRQWPEESAPFSGVTDVNGVVGQVATRDIFREQPILTSMVAESVPDEAAVLGEAARTVPRGMIARRNPDCNMSPTDGVLNDARPVEEWLYNGRAGETVTFVACTGLAQNLEPLLAPGIMVWNEHKEVPVQGEFITRQNRAQLAVHLPEDGLYVVTIMRPQALSEAVNVSFVYNISALPGRTVDTTIHAGAPPTPTPLPFDF